MFTVLVKGTFSVNLQVVFWFFEVTYLKKKRSFGNCMDMFTSFLYPIFCVLCLQRLYVWLCEAVVVVLCFLS
jgi:hypothetical protein